MFLEEMAYEYVMASADSAGPIAYGLTIGGALFAGLTSKTKAELLRVPYFVYSAVLFFLTSAVQIIWLGSAAALIGGYLWILSLVDISVRFGAGYALGLIAMARSRDTVGHGWLAVLAFIPFANLWLLFSPTNQGVSKNRFQTPPLVSGGLGIFFGFALLFAGVGGAAFVRTNVERNVQDSVELQEAGIDFLIRANGLEAALQKMAATVPPRQIDGSTSLLRAEADGTTFRYVYQIDTSVWTLTNAMRRGLIENNCGLEVSAKVLEAGTTIEHHYIRPDGTQLGTVSITQSICDSPKGAISNEPPEVDVESLIEASSAGEMYKALKRYFPDEARYFRESMESILVDKPSGDEAFSKMFKVGAEIRQRQAGNLWTTTDQSLKAILWSQIEMVVAFDSDPMLCNRVAMFGAGAIPASERHRALSAMGDVTVLYRAMYDGAHSPVNRGKPRDEDWGNLVQEFFEAGGTEADLDLIVEPDLKDTKLCGAMLKYLRVLRSADFPGADRIRAETVVAIIGG